MKKAFLAAALAVGLCVPSYAAEQYQPNLEANKASYPVFEEEDQTLANFGVHNEQAGEKQVVKQKRTQAAEKTGKEREFAIPANKNQDDNIDLTTGRITRDQAMRDLAMHDPDYVPPEKRKNRKKAVDGPQPVILNGDHVEFENATGDFLATGKVKLSQGEDTVLTSYAFGNMKTGDIYLLEGGTILGPGSRLEGKWLHFNYNSKTGEIKQIEGRGPKDFFKAPHAFILPDKVVADQGGRVTRCTAQKSTPCMHVEAKRVEFYPKEKMVAHDVKVFVKGKHIYSRKLWINEFKETRQYFKPSAGWDGKDNGWYFKLSDSEALSEKDTLKIDLIQYSRNGFKPQYKFIHDERNWKFTYANVWEEDDDWWYHKQNNYRFDYKPHHIADGLPLSYSAYFEYGLWSNYDIKSGKKDHKSWRKEYAYYINHDPIKLFGPDTTLHLTYGRKWIDEDYTNDKVATNMYYATIRQKIDSNKRMWASYLREKRSNSLFEIGQSDMDRELRLGMQWSPTKNDTLSVVHRYDVGEREFRNVGNKLITTRNYETTYNWYHRFCCWALQVSDEKEWYKDDHQIRLQYFYYNW